MSLVRKAPFEMTAAELKQRMFELNGIQQPERDAPKREWDEYFKACLLTTGMKIHGNKGKAKKFMEETWVAWMAR